MEGNSLNSFLNLCKIFEMRIKLDKENGVKSSSDVLDNYEKYCKKIDVIYNNDFQKDLKPLISPAVSLEKEKDRLRRLIKLLEDRLDKRVELEDRFYSITGKYISGLQIIVSDDELEEKRERFSLISKYLENSSEAESILDSINELKRLLVEEEEKVTQYEAKNKILEDELYSSFMNIVNSDEYYKNISADDITTELENIKASVVEAKETLDITKESIGALANNGLDDDYASYVEEAEKTYYNCKYKELILKIYKLVSEFEDDFKLICSKRDKINELLIEKKELINNLSIDTADELMSFEKVMLLQCNTLDNEREVLDNIVNYNSRIKFKEERLEELNNDNNSVEILAILREYGLIDTYDMDETLLSEEDNMTTDYEFSSTDEINNSVDIVISEKVYNPYRIVNVSDYPRTLNIGLAKLKGESVREKVNKKLNPKEDNAKVESEVLNLNENREVVINTSDNNEIVTKLEESQNNNVQEDKLPVWELPSDVEENKVALENDTQPVLPVWGTSISTELADVKEDNSSEIPSDMFWMPVSDDKVPASSFPNFNMPINNNINKNDEFVFPSINS